ncbi:hypothetical protein [Streptomyces sp. NPDC059378]|uniref:hypothetical protein n=1 Tax=Streptomyces sp. NPDC059378 TaxID=3346815 RepID=UPI00367E2DB9
MKVVTQVKLVLEADQAAALEATLRTVNDLACWVTAVAFAHGVPREYELRKHTYPHLPQGRRARGAGGAAGDQEGARCIHDAARQHPRR